MTLRSCFGNTRFHKGEGEERPGTDRATGRQWRPFMSTHVFPPRTAHCSTEGLAHLRRPMRAHHAGRSLRRWKGLRNPAAGRGPSSAALRRPIDLLMNLVKRSMLVRRAWPHLLPQTMPQVASTTLPAPADHDRKARLLPRQSSCRPTAWRASSRRARDHNEVVAIAEVPADAMILDVGPRSPEAIKQMD